ncbi:hypothetical protein HMPREF1631_02885 [Arcanobacterium sp. S3PF19]|nr:hypothetical protein HMPREF1631_02885 [Arcanobacterium sp. S3PF19]
MRARRKRIRTAGKPIRTAKTYLHAGLHAGMIRMPAGNGETRIQRIFTQGDAHTGSRRVRRQFSFSPLFPGDSAPPAAPL